MRKNNEIKKIDIKLYMRLNRELSQPDTKSYTKLSREIKKSDMILSITLNTYTYMDILINLLQEKFGCNTIEKITGGGIEYTVISNTTTKIKFSITTIKERLFLNFFIYINGHADYNTITEFVIAFIGRVDVKLCVAYLREQILKTTEGVIPVYWLEYNHLNPEDLKDAPIFSWEPIKKEILVRYVENPKKTTKEKLKVLNEQYGKAYNSAIGKNNEKCHEVVVEKISGGSRYPAKLNVNFINNYLSITIENKKETFPLKGYPMLGTVVPRDEQGNPLKEYRPLEDLRLFDAYLNTKGYRLKWNVCWSLATMEKS